MKKLHIFLLFLCTATGAYAQQDLSQLWDSMHRVIRQPGSMNTGYFWDQATPDSAFAHFRGSQADYPSSFTEWSDLYGQFRRAAVGDRPLPPTMEEVSKAMDVHYKNGLIPVAVLYAEAGKVLESAYEDKSLRFDSAMYAWVADRPERAFGTEKYFMAAPYLPVHFQPAVTLLFSTDLYFTNTAAQIRSIEFQLNNEPYRQTGAESSVTLSLLPGENLLQLKFLLSNGEVLESKTHLYFDMSDRSGGIANKFASINPFNLGDEKGNIYARELRQTELQDRLGAFIDYRPGYSNGVMNTCIKKPLIIVEGIDFGFKNFMTGFYGGKCGYVGLTDLENGYIYNPHAKNVKGQKEDWAAIAKGPRMLAELRNRGYDVFYIDFHNGAEYMENNAMLVVRCIQLINERKCSSEELVVLGASMGGVVARYALTYMEKQQMSHCVRTFLSFDAPQQGANIPLGFQSFIKNVVGMFGPAQDVLKRKIDRAATRQLLIYHILASYRSTAHADRKAFVHELKELGSYPKLCRNIALSNGSIDNSYQNFRPGHELLLMNPLSSKIEKNPVKFGANVYAFSLPFRQTEAIVLLGFHPFDKNILEKVEPGIYAPDHVPGSIRYDLRDARMIYGAFNILPRHSSACFIPTVSALDIRNEDVAADIFGRLDRYVYNPELYPFHTYYGVRNTNEEHMQLTDDNIAWAIDEIEKNRNELPVFLTDRYNYGRYERYTLPSVSIEPNAVLQINGHGLNGTGSGPFDRQNRKGSVFQMYTTDCSPLIVVGNNGSLILGDVNSPVQNKAVLRIRKGAVLMLKAGGILRIHDGSQLVIEEGGRLEYHAGARIILEGNEAQLRIDGTLMLGAGAVLKLEKGNAQHTGFIKFRNAKGGYGSARLEIGGKDAAIDLIGTGKHNDVLLQIEGEWSTIAQSGLHPLSYIRISHCKVLYGNKSMIRASADITLEQVYFGKLSWANKGSSSAFVLENNAKVQLKECEFRDLGDALRLNGKAGVSNQLSLDNCAFVACVNGVYAREAAVLIQYSGFAYCSENGIALRDPETDVKIFSCRLQACETGMSVHNSSTKPVYVFAEDCDVSECRYGISLNRCRSALTCCRFTLNTYGLSDDGGELCLSTGRQMQGALYSSAGGNNTFAYNSGAGVLLQSTLLHLENGYNNFLQHSSVSPCSFLSGNIAHSTATHESNAPYAFKAANNFWRPAPAVSLNAGTITHYLVSFPYPQGRGTAMNEFSGSMLGSLNKTCFDESACNPCAKYLAEHGLTDREAPPAADTIHFSISPQPAAEYLQILSNASELNSPLRMRLFSSEGKLIAEEMITVETHRLSTDGIAPGIYMLELSRDGQTRVKKVMISRER